MTTTPTTSTPFLPGDWVEIEDGDGYRTAEVVDCTTTRVAVKVSNFDGTFRTRVLPTLDVLPADTFDEGPTCSLCDAVGHGYPGAGPCPLENRGWEDAEEDRRREAAFGIF
jgi:hypothetical protein